MTLFRKIDSIYIYKFSSGTTNRGKDAGDITLAREGSKCGKGKVNMFYFLVVSGKLSSVP